eukprot:COSAG01_NODE_4609_length_4882_cov_2.470834_4_plen_105_part_00
MGDIIILTRVDTVGGRWWHGYKEQHDEDEPNLAVLKFPMFKVDMLTEEENKVLEKHKKAKKHVAKQPLKEKLRYKAMQIAYKQVRSLQENEKTTITDWHLRSVF